MSDRAGTGASRRPIADGSRLAFAHVMAAQDDRSWADDIRQRAAELTQCLDDVVAYEASVMQSVKRTRQLFRLPQG